MSKSIPSSIKEEVLKKVENYNQRHGTSYEITFRSRFAYLSKIKKEQSEIKNFFLQALASKMGIDIPENESSDNGANIIETKIGRLQFNGQVDNWDFAVFRYSNEKYDPNEFMFPGAGKLNGTIEGALNAGLEIYP